MLRRPEVVVKRRCKDAAPGAAPVDLGDVGTSDWPPQLTDGGGLLQDAGRVVRRGVPWPTEAAYGTHHRLSDRPGGRHPDDRREFRLGSILVPTQADRGRHSLTRVMAVASDSLGLRRVAYGRWAPGIAYESVALPLSYPRVSGTYA